MNKTNLDDCPEYLREFLFYMETIKGRSSRTVDGYYIDLREFMRYVKKKHGLCPTDTQEKDVKIADLPFSCIEEIKLADAHEFLYYCQNEHGNNAKTRSRKVSALRSFYKYLTVATNKLKTNPLEHLEVPSTKKALPKYLTLDQARTLLVNVDSSFPERDYCIITLFLNCGMRLSELVGLNKSDVITDRENGTVSLRLLGKGNKERIVYLNEACTTAINEYYKAMSGDSAAKRIDKNAMFLNNRGGRISGRRVEQIVETCLKNAGLSGMGFSPHKLRHTAATLLYQNGGVDIRILQELLGHVSLATTEIYTHVSSEQLENAAQKSPIKNEKPPKRKQTKKDMQE